MIAVFNSVDPSVPKNAGSFRCIEVQIRDGGVVGRPAHPISCSASTTNLADRIQNATQLALAEISPDAGMGEIGCFCPPSTAVVSGIDPRDGKPYVNQLFLGHTGGAGAATQDAWLTMLHAGNGGMCFIDSVELDEVYTPIIVKTRRLVTDSEGAGTYRGAPGILVEYGPVGARMQAIFIADGNINNPKGARGGDAAARSQQLALRKDGQTHALPQYCDTWLEAGETLISVASGGGGYGSPALREPARVLEDVREKLVSRERARDVYRVAITEAFAIDEDTTASLRSV